MPEFNKFIHRADVQRYFALAIILLILWVLRNQISIVLLTTIFGYLAITNAKKVKHHLHIPYALSVVTVYLIVIALFALALRFIVPLLITQFAAIPGQVDVILKDYPTVQHYAHHLYQRFNVFHEVTSNWKVLLSGGWRTLSQAGHVITQILLSIFLSFVLAFTWETLKAFGRQFKQSLYPHLFENIYELAGSFVVIFGGVIEVQLKIAFINTILMMLGMWVIQLPSILVMGLIVFILGLIPIAGVILSLIPLSLVALASQGIPGLLELLVLTAAVHMFESYFLHPRMMSDRLELPVFVSFTALIIMEHLLGGWGLMVGLPIVAFTLNLLGVEHAQITSEFDMTPETDTKDTDSQHPKTK
ncbi:AI-2E family transporter [Weissella viridescens]|uniref:AI-2E family transporter n=1 Tax=Weissella viridescens TaxID=1629 RepID=A0A3P2RFC0_WEIVI|nr:AI-2E family transporter [Weissella viridescens]RRG18155.1 AI-2E family transporter [Weissella viridescens]